MFVVGHQIWTISASIHKTREALVACKPLYTGPHCHHKALGVMRLVDLPPDLLIDLLDFLDIDSLICFAATSKKVYDLVTSRIPTLTSKLSLDNIVTLPCIKQSKDSLIKIRYGIEVQQRFRHWEATLTPLSNPVFSRQGHHKSAPRVLPVLAFAPHTSSLLYGHNASLTIYNFNTNGRVRTCHETKLGNSSFDDITAIASAVNNSALYTAHVSGMLQECALEKGSAKRRKRLQHPTIPIQALSTNHQHLASVAKNGRGRGLLHLYSLSGSALLHTFSLSSRPWSVQLSPGATPSSWVAIGQKGDCALELREISPTGVEEQAIKLQGCSTTCAVYDIASPPPNSPLSIFNVVSGWYDGVSRVHDLRDGRSALEPVMSFMDPYSDEAVYSIGIGGAGGNYLAVGASRHSMLRIFDIRGKDIPITLYTAREDSPVYSLQMEHSRIFAATQSGVFQLDFNAPKQDQKTYQRPITYYKHEKHLQMYRVH